MDPKYAALNEKSGQAAAEDGCRGWRPAVMCCSVCSCMLLLPLLLLLPVGRDSATHPYSGGLTWYLVNGEEYSYQNYYKKLMAFSPAASKADFRAGLAEWFAGFTGQDPTVGTGLGSSTTMYYSYSTVKEKLQLIGPSIAAGTLKRESELALAVFNNIMWPEAGKFSLGLPNEDHAVLRPYLARMFDAAKGQAGGWTDGSLREEFRAQLADVTSFSNDNTPGARFSWDVVMPSRGKLFLTKVVLKVLHRVALGIDLSDAEALELAALQTTLLGPAFLPPLLARTLLIQGLLTWRCAATKRKYMEIYKAAVQRKWPGEDWPERKVALVASGFFDAMWAAGGRSVPLALDIVLGYILTRNRPPALLGVDFTVEANVKSLMVEAMRFHAPVTVFPQWVTSDGGNTWQHEYLVLDRALSDPAVFPNPDVFRLDREANLELSVSWGDFALVDGDTAHPNSHACPGKELSISMVLAFVKEFQDLGPWNVTNDDIHMTYYGSSGFTVTRQPRALRALRAPAQVS